MLKMEFSYLGAIISHRPDEVEASECCLVFACSGFHILSASNWKWHCDAVC